MYKCVFTSSGECFIIYVFLSVSCRVAGLIHCDQGCIHVFGGVGGCHDSAALISTKQPGGSVGSAVTALHMFSYPLNMNHQQTHVQCQNQRILPASCCGICNVCGALSSKQALMEEPALLCMRE